ncbi:MAG: hypothetical protein IJ087_15585 [Eggerthellaceae bacterium]|nr:hypothetical protein [Eggerthellaceae bacterium]
MEDSDVNGQNPMRKSPFLVQWKTSVGAFVVGLICNAVLGGVVGRLSSALWLVAIIYVFAVVYYALAYYPSLFKDGARARSSAAVSFGNAFFGGLVFGAIWNSCLANGKIGISHYVFVGLLAAIFIFSFIAAYYA